jgi:hypothetical protein
MLSSIWVADDHRLAGRAGGAQDPPLDARHPLGRHLDPEVAARDHHRVRAGHDLLEPPDRRRLLELGHDRRPAAGERPDLVHVLRPLDEGERHPVDAQPEREVEVAAVLPGQGRDRQHGADHAHALAVRERPAGDHPRVGEVGAAVLDGEPDLAVVQQQVTAWRERGEDLGVRQPRPTQVAGPVVEVEAEGRPGLQPDRAGGEGSDPELRALQVEQHADRPAHRPLHVADRLEPGSVVVVAAVAEVQPEHVGPGLEQAADRLRRRTRRPERGDDLGVAVASHGGPPARGPPLRLVLLENRQRRQRLAEPLAREGVELAGELLVEDEDVDPVQKMRLVARHADARR